MIDAEEIHKLLTFPCGKVITFYLLSFLIMNAPASWRIPFSLNASCCPCLSRHCSSHGLSTCVRILAEDTRGI